MSERSPSVERLTQYLLGELSEEDAAKIEDLVFEEDEPYVLLRAAEDDLVDAYVAGELPPGRVHRFEARFLATAEGKQRVAMARALARRMRSSAPAPASTPATGRLGMAERLRAWSAARFVRVLTPAVAVAALLVVMFVPRPPTELTLTPQLRGSGPGAVVPRRALRLELHVDRPPPAWRVIVERGGAVVFESRGEGAVRVTIPRDALAAGLHDVRLDGADGNAVEHYRFRVED